MAKGLKVEQVNNLTLFKFTEELGDSLPERLRQRLQILIDKKRADSLTQDEMIELESIGELDEIFSYINAQMATRANGHT
jgi:septum formation topological specificity factor MinE